MSRPNIIQIVADQHHRDALGCADQATVSTPYLDGIAKHGMVFEQASTHTLNTAAASISLFSGRFPRAEEKAVTTQWLPKRLRKSGYTTAYIGSAAGCPAKAGFDHTHLVHAPGTSPDDDEYCDWLREREAPVSVVRAHREPKEGPAPISQEWNESTWIATQAVRFLKSTSEPFYLSIHFPQPMPPFCPPQPWASQYKASEAKLFAGLTHIDLTKIGQKRLAWYKGLVSHVDSQIGRVLGMLSAQGQTNTIMIYTANQGHAFGAQPKDNGATTMAIHEAESRIPLIISGVHGQRRGVRSRVLTQHTDMAPTLLDLVGLNPDPDGDGLSLVGHLRGEKRVVHRGAYCETREGQSVMRNKDYSLVLNAAGEAEGVYAHHDTRGALARNLLGSRKHITAQVQLMRAIKHRLPQLGQE
jgi:arylsulfatase A-like enzyme